MIENKPMIKIKTLESSTNIYLSYLKVLEQSRIHGGLEAANSISLHNNGSFSAINIVHFQPRDKNKVVNQINASSGSFVYLPYQNNGNVLNQVATNGSNILVVLQGF